MGNAKFIGRVGALAVALGVGVAATIAPGAALAETDETPSTGASTDRTALIMGGTTIPTPDDHLVELIKNQYIAPTHPGQDIDYVAVTTPQEGWPLTGFLRLVGFALGPAEPVGPGWPGCGRTSRGGNSRGYSTSPSISRSGLGSSIWSTRWPSTATTIW